MCNLLWPQSETVELQAKTLASLTAISRLHHMQISTGFESSKSKPVQVYLTQAAENINLHQLQEATLKWMQTNRVNRC